MSNTSVEHRALAPIVEQDLEHKMVFVAGPRQVGKTTMARALAGVDDGYRNWDIREHRKQLLGQEMPTSLLWVLDEVHKYHRWRN